MQDRAKYTAASLAGSYADKYGQLPLTWQNDGLTLALSVLGVTFTGRDFDSLEPAEGTSESSLERFVLHDNSLCACTLTLDGSITMVSAAGEIDALFRIHLVLGSPRSTGALDEETLRLDLQYGETSISSAGTSGWFEDEMLDLQRKLAPDVFIKACINCLYSDYSPYGHGLFGHMMCFRNIKGEYLAVQSKEDFWDVHGRQDRFVQETYLCSEFARRIPGTGYRG